MIRAVIFDWVGTLTSDFETPFPFSEEVLQRLKRKYKLGLVTLASQGVEKRWQDIINSGLQKYFDFCVVETEKSERQYQECIDKLGVKPADTAVVDDMLVRCQIAASLGCKAYWVVNNSLILSPVHESVDKIEKIDSVNDLINLILR